MKTGIGKAKLIDEEVPPTPRLWRTRRVESLAEASDFGSSFRLAGRSSVALLRRVDETVLADGEALPGFRLLSRRSIAEADQSSGLRNHTLKLLNSSILKLPKCQPLPTLATGGNTSPSSHDPRPFRNSLIGNVRRARSCWMADGGNRSAKSADRGCAESQPQYIRTCCGWSATQPRSRSNAQPGSTRHRDGGAPRFPRSAFRVGLAAAMPCRKRHRRLTLCFVKTR